MSNNKIAAIMKKNNKFRSGKKKMPLPKTIKKGKKK